jgi:hypothetical protein
MRRWNYNPESEEESHGQPKMSGTSVVEPSQAKVKCSSKTNLGSSRTCMGCENGGGNAESIISFYEGYREDIKSKFLLLIQPS